jgi:hypothetical protein
VKNIMLFAVVFFGFILTHPPLLVSVGGNLTCYTEGRKTKKEERRKALVMCHVTAARGVWR